MSAQTVYTGFWTNWSYGSVHGSTLTLSAQSSAFLVAFIALWVSFAGGQLWAALIFLISVKRSTAKPQDCLYHQQQAILRNSSDAKNVFWNMLKLSWFWKTTATKARLCVFGYAFSSLAYIAAFAIAGIFSSKIATKNSEVLILPIRTCGTWPYPYSSEWDPAKSPWQDYSIERLSFWSNYNTLARRSHFYVSECYNSTHEDLSGSCLPHGRERISWTTNSHATCPFDKEMCIADAVEFDTGFMSSRTHFGINTKDDHIEYRRVMTCSPITTEGYTTGYVKELNISDDAQQIPFESDEWIEYTYGQNSGYFNDNTTFAYGNFSWGASFGTVTGLDIYRLDAEISCAAPDEIAIGTTPSFTAISSLSRTDADTTLVFLSLNASYLSPVHDPWFEATTLTVLPDLGLLPGATGPSKDTSLYNRNAPVNVVGCTEQHQFRNPNTGFTTRLGGQELFEAEEQAQLGFNENQQALYNRSFWIGSSLILMDVVAALGGNLLLASEYLTYESQSVSLPENQWQLEFNHYFGVGLDAMQIWAQQYVTGLPDTGLNKYVVPASDDFGKDMCHNQITRRADYRSFSVLGLCIVLIAGVLFLILNLSIGPIVKHLQNRSLEGRYRNAEWQANDFLQLQRMAYEHKDIGTWKGQNDIVPRTHPDETFTIPDSTGWKEGSLGRTKSTQSWSSRRKIDDQQNETTSPSSSMKDTDATSAFNLDKRAQITELQVRT